MAEGERALRPEAWTGQAATGFSHIGCCDSSPGKHATGHFHSTMHPVMVSFEPRARWAWCYIDEAQLEVPAGALPFLK
jgi:hypothetical protein